MTKCVQEFCEDEGLVQYIEHSLYNSKVIYWLCDYHYREKMKQPPKPLELEEAQLNYVETPNDWEETRKKIYKQLTKWGLGEPIPFILAFVVFFSSVVLGLIWIFHQLLAMISAT